MSAILSADDLNDFISPGVACIKPIETLPVAPESTSAYEVTTEEAAAAAEPPPPAQISLTDCLACSGCVTSAEAVLVQLQSHNEVLATLDAHAELPAPWAQSATHVDLRQSVDLATAPPADMLFVASVSPQARASLAAVFGVSETEAGNMVQQLLSGPQGVRGGGHTGAGFTWVLDTDVVRDMCLVAAADEVMGTGASAVVPVGAEGAIDTPPKQPILTSACPGWICYAEKTHPYVLPHLSRLKSPQALAGTLVKSVLARNGVPPNRVWHLAIMPCFDKKLEASRSELTSAAWSSTSEPVRDVDCVITARELLQLASARGIHFSSLPRDPITPPSFPDTTLHPFLFPAIPRPRPSPAAGPSGGYLHHILSTYSASHPGSTISTNRGRNADVIEYTLLSPAGAPIMRTARFYGFRNIQNLVRRLKPARASRLPGGRAAVRRPTASKKDDTEYSYVEVMACPGGCTNGGGQVKIGDVDAVRGEEGLQPLVGADKVLGPVENKTWLGRVDEAYFSSSSASSSDDEPEPNTQPQSHTPHTDSQTDLVVNGISHSRINALLTHWERLVGVSRDTLLCTSFRKVESDVGKKVSDVERVAGLAVSVGGGW